MKIGMKMGMKIRSNAPQQPLAMPYFRAVEDSRNQEGDRVALDLFYQNSI